MSEPQAPSEKLPVPIAFAAAAVLVGGGAVVYGAMGLHRYGDALPLVWGALSLCWGLVALHRMRAGRSVPAILFGVACLASAVNAAFLVRNVSRPQLDIFNRGRSPVTLKLHAERLVLPPGEYASLRHSIGDQLEVEGAVAGASKSFVLDRWAEHVKAEVDADDASQITFAYLK